MEFGAWINIWKIFERAEFEGARADDELRLAWANGDAVVIPADASAKTFVPASMFQGDISSATFVEWLANEQYAPLSADSTAFDAAVVGYTLYDLFVGATDADGNKPLFAVDTATVVEAATADAAAVIEIVAVYKTMEDILADVDTDMFMVLADLLDAAFQSEVMESTAVVAYRLPDAATSANLPDAYFNLSIQQASGQMYYEDGIRVIDDSHALRSSFNPALWGEPMYTKPITTMTEDELSAGEPVYLSWADAGWNNMRIIGSWRDGTPMYDNMAKYQPDVITKYNEMYRIPRGTAWADAPGNVIAVHNSAAQNIQSALGSPNPNNGTGAFLFVKYYLGLENERYDSYEFLYNYVNFGKIQNGQPVENPTYFVDGDLARVEEVVAHLDALVKTFADGEVAIVEDYVDTYHDGAPRVVCTIDEITGPIPIEVMNAAYWNCAEKDYSINHSDLIYPQDVTAENRWCFWFDRVLSEDAELVGKPVLQAETQRTQEIDWQITTDLIESDGEYISYQISWGQYLDSRFAGSEIILNAMAID